MNKRFTGILAVILVFALILVAGCSSQTAAPAASDTPQKEEIPNVLALATNPTGTLTNTMGAGIATVLTKSMGVQVKTVPLNGPQEWFPMTNTEEVDMGVLSSYDSQLGYQGKSSFAEISGNKGFDIRLITIGHKNISMLITTNDSGIKTGADLKGKRYAGIISSSAGLTLKADAILANLGLTRDDVEEITVPNIAEAVLALQTGRADATYVGEGTPQVQELDASNKGCYVVSLDPSPEAVKNMFELYPAKIIPIDPGPKSVGVKEPNTMVMANYMYMVGRSTLNDTTVYTVVKNMWENNKELTEINSSLSDWTTDVFLMDDFVIPYHDGAIKFYKEKGIWTEDMEKRQQELLASKK